MKPLSVARMMHAAITAALHHMVKDPKTMTALDEMASGFVSIDRMMSCLWTNGDIEAIGATYSTTKQEAVLTVTGKPWSWWTGLIQK